jgi:hypothetical protein
MSWYLLARLLNIYWQKDSRLYRWSKDAGVSLAIRRDRGELPSPPIDLLVHQQAKRTPSVVRQSRSCDQQNLSSHFLMLFIILLYLINLIALAAAVPQQLPGPIVIPARVDVIV